MNRLLVAALALLFAGSAQAALPGRSGLTSFASLDSDAIAYFNALSGNSCTAPTNGFKLAVNTYITAEKAAGNWGNQSAEYILLTSDSCTASVNLAQPSLYKLTWNGSCTFSAINGLNGDAATCDGDTGVNMSALKRLTQNNSHAESFGGIVTSGGIGSNLGLDGILGTLFISNIPNRVWRLTAGVSLTETGGGCTGLSWADRTSSSQITTGCNGSITSNGVASASAALSAAHVVICKSNASFCPAIVNMKFAGFGAAMNNETAHAANVSALIISLSGAYTAQALFTQANTNLCDLVSSQENRLIVSFFSNAASHGYFTNLDGLWVLGTPDECLSLMNWAQPALYTLTPKSAKINWYQWQGFQTSANGVQSYIDIGTNANGFTHYAQNSAHASAYVLSNTAGVQENEIGTLGADALTLATSDTSGNQIARLNASAAVNSGVGAAGLFEIDRPNSATINTCTNGVLTGNGLASTSTTPPAAHVTFLQSGATPVYSDNILMAATLGAALSSTDCANLYSDLHTLLVGQGSFSPSSDAVSGSPYFTNAMDSQIAPSGFRVSIIGTCPGADINNQSYTSFPMNVCSPQNILPMVTSTYSTGKAGHDLWGNRYNGGPNGEPNQQFPAVVIADGHQCRLQFSSKLKGDAATLANVSFTAGFAAHDAGGLTITLSDGTVTHAGYNDILEAVGLPDAMTYTDFAAQKEALCTTPYNATYVTAPVDTTVTLNGRLADITSMPRDVVMIDWEVQDNHTTSETTAFFTAAAALAHNKSLKVELYTNDMTLVVGPENGLTAANVDTISGVIDYFDLLITDYQVALPYTVLNQVTRQEALFTSPNYAKMQIAFELGALAGNGNVAGTSIADAYTIRNRINTLGYAGVRFFDNFAVRGGSDPCRPTNQKIAIMAFGHTACSSPLP